MVRVIYCLILIIAGGLVPDKSFAKDEVVELCFDCHTADNNNPDPIIPKLIGQRQEYLLKEMESFRLGKRHDTTMIDIARSLKDRDLLVEILEFYSSQPVMKGQPSNEPLVDKGRALYYVRHCDFCHGKNGWCENTFLPGAPIIGGQNSEYLYKTLLELRDSTRPTDKFGLMQRSLLQLSTDEIVAITKYLASR